LDSVNLSKRIQDLIQVISHSRSLCTISLKNTRVSGAKLCKSIVNSKLKYLDISENPLRSSDIEILSKANLKMLLMNRVPNAHSRMSHLAKMKIQSLILRNNNIDLSGTLEILKELKQSHRISTIDLSWNYVLPIELEPHLPLISESITLEYFNISYVVERDSLPTLIKLNRILQRNQYLKRFLKNIELFRFLKSSRFDVQILSVLLPMISSS
jgi:hypothetical protein